MDDSMTPSPPGWRIWHSNAGRSWATRQRSLSRKEIQASLSMTLDADTDDELLALIAEQDAKSAELAKMAAVV
jgi:hypothetical protein